MCNCKDLISHLNSVEAKRAGLIDYPGLGPHAQKRLVFEDQVYDCKLLRCIDCDCLWEGVPSSPYWRRVSSTHPLNLRQSEEGGSRDPNYNSGYVYQKVSQSPSKWHERMERLYEEVRKPALEGMVEEHKGRGYHLYESKLTYARLVKETLKKGLFGQAGRVVIMLWVDLEGRELAEVEEYRGGNLVKSFRRGVDGPEITY